MSELSKSAEIPPAMWELLDAAAAKLPESADKMLQAITATQPHSVLVCDRGARPVGYAVEALAKARQEECPPITYMQVSQTIPAEVLARHVSEHASEIAGADNKKIFVIDDHMRSGATKLAFYKACRAAGIAPQLTWATLTGKGSDIVTQPGSGPNTAAPWNDMPRIMGVDYDEGSQKLGPISYEASHFYELIDGYIDTYADR